MKTNFILLSTTIVFALLTITFGYQPLLSNYQNWICWDSCVWEIFEECEEICKDAPEKQVELTRDEKKEKSQKLRDMYNPIFEKYTSSVGIAGGTLDLLRNYQQNASFNQTDSSGHGITTKSFCRILKLIRPHMMSLMQS